MTTLTINKKTYPVKWDYSVIRFFCKRRGIEKISEYAKRIGTIRFDENLTVENIEDLAHMTLSLIDRGVEVDGGVNDLSINDAFDWIYSDTKNIETLNGIIAGAIRDVSPQKKTAKNKKAH